MPYDLKGDIPGFPGYRVGADGSIWSAMSSVMAYRVLAIRFRTTEDYIQRIVSRKVWRHI